MLRNKYRVAAHGCLLTVIGNFCGCQPFGNKLFGMIQNDWQTFLLKVMQVPVIEVEAVTKTGTLQRLKQLVQVTHGI